MKTNRNKNGRIILPAMVTIAMLMSLFAGMTSVVSAGTTLDTSWYNNLKQNFTLSDEADLRGLAQLVNDGTDDFEGDTIVLSENISLTGTWTPIGTAKVTTAPALENPHPFKGTFDGKGKTISGLSITTAPTGFSGLFGYNAGTIKDLTVTGNITLDSASTGGYFNDAVGGLCGYSSGIVSGIVSNVTINTEASSMYALGGVVGQCGAYAKSVSGGDWEEVISCETGATVSNCINTASITGKNSVGGIVGRLQNGTITECVNTAAITGKGGRKDAVAGIVGNLGGQNNATYWAVVNNSYNTGSVKNEGGRWFGGIAGFGNEHANTKVANCYSIGDMGPGHTEKGGWGGIVGNSEVTPAGKVNCYSLEGKSYVGGDEVYLGTQSSEAEFKIVEMTTLLGGKYVIDSGNKNGGYPILSWQATGTEVADTASAKSAQTNIDALPTMDSITGSSDDMQKISAAVAAYEGLSDTLKTFVTGADKLEPAKEKVAKINHTSGGVTVEGLPWDVKIVVSPVADGAAYDAMKAFGKDKEKSLLGMYDISLYEYDNNNNNKWVEFDLNGDSVQVSIVNDAFKGYYKAKAIHQTETQPSQYGHEEIDATITGNKVTFGASEFSNYGIVGEKAPEATKTGDDFNLIPILIIMLIAAAGATVVIVQRKRKEQ